MSVTQSDFMKSHCRNPVWILAFSWVFGLSIGLFLVFRLQGDFTSLMRAAVLSRVSIVGLLVILLFPFVSSFVAASFSRPALLFLCAAGKGLCFSFCIYLIMAEFPTTGWLLCRLLLFSDFAVLVPLFLFWIRHLSSSKQSRKRDSLLYLIVALAAGVVDYCIISPFTANLMMHS